MANPELRSQSAWFNTRAALLAAWAVIFLGVLFALAGPSWLLCLLRLGLGGGLPALLWVIACAGIGWWPWKILANQRGENLNPALAFATCTALGIGILSLVILGLGLAGILNRFTAYALTVAGIIIALTRVFVHRANFNANAWLKKSADWHWLWIVIAPLAAIVVLGAFFPPGMLWGDEPQGYDVVEYHLQVPREWFELGRIVALRHNVFSFMPFNVEMHFLLAMHLYGSPWAGMYLAQLMHFMMCALAAVAVYGLAGGGARGTIAGVLVAAAPWTGLLGAVAYNDGGTILFGALAIGWALRARIWRQFLLAGLMAGFAGGCKLPVLPLLVIGVPLVAIFFGQVPRKKAIALAAVYLLAAGVALSPWLIRNWVWTRNPVFPEMMDTFGKAHFSDVQAERWQRAYLPELKYRSALGRADALWEQVLIDPRYGFALFPAGILAAILSLRNRKAVGLLLLLAVQVIVWTCFTHVQARFMVIAIPILALLVAQCERPQWRLAGLLTVMIVAAVSTSLLAKKIGRFVEADRQFQSGSGAGLIGRENLTALVLLDYSRLPGNVQVDLVGDARAFLYQIPTARLHYKTVFDVDTSDQSQSIVEAWLAGMPVGKDVLAWPDADELARFAKTYYGIPSLPAPTSRPSSKSS